MYNKKSIRDQKSSPGRNKLVKEEATKNQLKARICWRKPKPTEEEKSAYKRGFLSIKVYYTKAPRAVLLGGGGCSDDYVGQ